MVTAVITTYKRNNEVVMRAIQSVRNQTSAHWELIIVDDSPSTYPHRDSVRDVIANINDERITYVRHEKTMGACAARNTGLAVAKGEFIGFLDDDDEWLPEKLERQVAMFQANSEELALVYCKRWIFNEQTGEQWLPEETFSLFQTGYVYDTLIFQNYIGSTSFPLMRTRHLREIGGFDVELLSCQDYDVWLRLSQRYTVAYVDAPLVRYYRHAGEAITTNIEKKLQGHLRLNEKNQAYLHEHRKAHYARILVLAPMYIRAGMTKRAFATMGKASCLCPEKCQENLVATVRLLKRWAEKKRTKQS